jgi:phosphohistidine phosphatase
MELYLIRHGAAVELDKEIAEEGFRYLSPEGRKLSYDVAKKLKELKTRFDLIISSPLVRAVQTAEIFATVLNHKGEMRTAIELIGGISFTRFLHLIKRNSHHKSIAFFGHSPDVSHFSVNLIRAHPVKEHKINFKNCSVCKIHYDPATDEGKFAWFLRSDTMEITR